MARLILPSVISKELDVAGAGGHFMSQHCADYIFITFIWEICTHDEAHTSCYQISRAAFFKGSVVNVQGKLHQWSCSL